MMFNISKLDNIIGNGGRVCPRFGLLVSFAILFAISGCGRKLLSPVFRESVIIENIDNIDNTPPKLSIQNSETLSFINLATNSPEFQVSGSCDENGGKVLALVDGKLNGPGAICTGATFKANIDTTILEEGTHTLTVSLADSAGNIGTSDELKVIKDTIKPSAPSGFKVLNAYSSSENVEGNIIAIGTSTSPTLKISGLALGDGISLHEGDPVCLENSKIAFGQSVGIDLDLTLNISNEGTHIIYQKVVDLAGNATCGDTSVYYTLDLTVPFVTGLQNDISFVKSKNWSWGCSETGCTYRYVISPSATWEPTGDFMSLSEVFQGSGEGIYYLHVQAKDLAGNFSLVSTVSANLDNEGPVLSNVSSPGPLPLPAGTSQATFEILTNESASCKASTVQNTPYDFMQYLMVSEGGFSHTTTAVDLKDGWFYTYYIKCIDKAGNENPGDFQVHFSILSPPPAYHVNNQIPCSDLNNSGSIDKPWCTFQKGLTSLQSGETLFVHAGVYRVTNPTTLQTSSGFSGTANAPTLVKNYPGSNPQIHLSEGFTPGWEIYQGKPNTKIWRRKLIRQPNNPPEMVAITEKSNGSVPVALLRQVHSFVTSGCGIFKFQDNLFLPEQIIPNSRPDPKPKLNQDDMESGDFFYDIDNQFLYVSLWDGSDPNTHIVEVGASPGIDLMNRSYFKIEGLELRYGNTANHGFVQTETGWKNGQKNCTSPVINLVFSHHFEINNVKILYSDTDGLGIQLVSNAAIRNTIINHNGHSGVSGFANHNLLFESNTLDGNHWRGFLPSWAAAGFKFGFGSSDNVVRGNLIRNTGNSILLGSIYSESPGIWYDLGGPNTLFEQNTLENNAGPGLFVEISTGSPELPIMVRNNFVINNDQLGLAAGILLSGGSNIYLFHNTLQGNGIQLREGDWPLGVDPNADVTYATPLSDNKVMNNIVVGPRVNGASLRHVAVPLPGGQMWDGSVAVYNNTVENNLYFNNDNTPPLFWVFAIGGTGVVIDPSLPCGSLDCVFDSWKQVTSHDKNSFIKDPKFLSPAAPYDFHLKPDSKAIDKAVPLVPGVPTDFENDLRPNGNGFDIGADEWVDS